MKKVSLLITFCLAMFQLNAAYLTDVPVTLTQPDGTVLHCFASGDEFFNYLHDKDGYTIIQHPKTGFYVYADKRDGKLVPTDFVAGTMDPASKNLTPYNLISPEEWIQRRKAWDVEDPRPKNRDGQPNHGTLNNIAIFVRFSDDSEFTNAYSDIDNMFNDMSGAYSTSMRSYFRAASYGAIDIPTTFYPGHNGDVIISYQDTHPRCEFQPYNQTTNPDGYQDDSERKTREFDLLERAVNYINEHYPIPSNLNIDYDNDGYVDNVCFIVRGTTGEWNSLLWPHKWTLHDRTVSINGKRVFVFNFQLADATSYFNTSTMCHEMNHSLSAPDLYHYYNGKTLSPVGRWDLMESNAKPPQHCGAYMKMKYGHWINEIPEITQAGTYTLNPISSATPDNVAYKIATEDPCQFYVLEYRSRTTETAIPGSGLLIYRIDTHFEGNADYDPDNGIYDEIYLFRPGGTYNANGTINNAHFSSNVNRTEFSSSTDPYPFFSGGTLVDNNVRIYDITSAGNTISFKYGTTSSCEPPTNLSAIINGRNASLTWDEAENAQSYNIYRDGVFIANTTGTSYTDSDLSYKVFRYSLKSVDAQNLLSIFSEEILVDIQPVPSMLTVVKEGDDAQLRWQEPEWSYPENPSATLTYGNGQYNNDNVGFGDGTKIYWGHRYPSTSLGAYDGKALYGVSFFTVAPGTYKMCVYEGCTTSSNGQVPEQQVAEQSCTFSASGWSEIVLDNPHIIDATKDLWVFMFDDNGYGYPAACSNYDGEYGNLCSTNPLSWVHAFSGTAWLINANVTDGTYTYNLYDNGTKLNEEAITGDSYTHENPSNNAIHRYTLKTIYNGGETRASNMAGITLENTTLSSLELGEHDMVTVTSGSTFTVSGTLSNDNPANLVIEDGAQLIHNSNNVAATVERSIEGYGETNSGWYTVATPFTTYDPTDEITLDEFDLYAYDEDASLEWINYKAHQQDFVMTPGAGYLYAHQAGTTLRMAGILNSGNYSEEITLSYANVDENLRGFNLLGNPTAHNITFSKTDGVSDGYYYLDNGNVWVYVNSDAVPAGRGFLVKANAANQSVMLNPQSKRGDDDAAVVETVHAPSLQIDVDGDKTYVKMTDGVSMPLLQFRGNASSVYLTRDGEPYIMLVRNDANTIDLGYRPKRFGRHELSVNAEDLGLDYLHLIDHLTGADIDLLANPTYTFESNETDYASRFQLVFDENENENESDTFAFISNGQIIVTADAHGASLQVIDALGRVIVTRRDAMHCVSTEGMTPGVYVVRLITENNIKTQKIIVNN